MPSVTIIVPARNSQQTIHKCLSALINLDKSGITLEILVVDNASTDATSAIASSLGIRVIECLTLGRSQARNFGARLSQSDFLAFVDSDTYLPPDWLIKVIPKFTQLSVGAVQTAIMPGPEGTFLNDFRKWHKSHYFHPSFIEMESSEILFPLLDTAAVVVRKVVFDKLDGFDEGLINTENFYFALGLVSLGFSIRTLREPVCVKDESRSSSGFLLRAFSVSKEMFRMDLDHAKVNRLSAFCNSLSTMKSGKVPYIGRFYWYDRLIAFSSVLGLFYGFMSIKRVERKIMKWPVSKYNFLLPKVSFQGKVYCFSGSKRFCLNEGNLIIYGYELGLSRSFKQAQTVNFFNRFLDGNGAVVADQESEAFLELVASEVFTVYS